MWQDSATIAILAACKRIKQERGIELNFPGSFPNLDVPGAPNTPYPNCTWMLSANGLSGTVTVQAKNSNYASPKTEHKIVGGSIVLWQHYEVHTSGDLYVAITFCVDKLEEGIRPKRINRF